MVGVVGLTAVLVIILVNSTLAALATRFFRVRLATSWGSLLYTILFVPLGLVVLIPVYSFLFGRFMQVGSNTVLLIVAIVVPLSLGLTFDYFWMPAPDQVELSDQL